MAEHPWELTLRQFLEQVRRDYGVEISITGTSGQFLIHDRKIWILPDIEDDRPLPPELLRVLCQLFNLPSLDFALDPEEDDD